jgi:replicative DNA helicase
MDIKDEITKEQALATHAGEDRIISSTEMQKLIKADSRREIEIKSLLPTLDHTLGGFNAGQLTTITGLTGEGKTTFAQTVTSNFAKQDIASVWFSYEVLPKYFLRGFGEKPPLFYMPAKLQLNSVEWLKQRIQEAKLKYDCRAVFVDHLHFLVDMRSHNNMSLEIGYVMRSLKRIAVDLNVCFFLIAHLAKVAPETEPDNSSLRDSSFIAQESDNVLIIWRKKDHATDAVLKVAKNRKTGERRKIDITKFGNRIVEKSDIEVTYE